MGKIGRNGLCQQEASLGCVDIYSGLWETRACGKLCQVTGSHRHAIPPREQSWLLKALGFI